jgi:hypothetical protein
VQHFCTLRGVILQTRQRIIAVVTLLRVITLVEPDDCAVN